ncbi:MAG: YolD-like family protein [Erysipelotrichaceae bacterium]|nr:YolD-like family protein [Erysipelotrichaceae bacterium]
MKNAERGMVKYAPYKSLVEQSSYLATMRARRAQVEKRVFLDDEVERIDEILTHCDDQPLIVFYWKNGFIHKEEGLISKIDPYARVISINETVIPLDDLQGIERK